MSSFSNKLLNRNTKKSLKRRDQEKGSISYSEANKVGILFTVVDRTKHEAVKKFIKKLEKDCKKVDVLCLLPEGKDNYDFIFDYFTTNDFTLFGNTASQSILLFIQQEFDYLFVLDTTSNIYIENLLAKSSAKCRVGIFDDNNGPYFELMIKISNNNTEELTEQIYHYLNLLSK